MTKSIFQDFVGGEGMQHFNNRSEPLDQFSIALPKFVKDLCLFFEYNKDRIGAVAAIDLGGEWVIAKIFASFLGVLLQGSIENGLEVGGRGCRIGCRHGIRVDICQTF